MDTTMTQNTNPKYRLEFLGNGSEYFSIMIVNWLLTLVTFGLYYPWARAKTLRYVYGQTALNNERFHFSGTGKEIFRGFIKIILFYFAVVGAYLLLLFVLHSPIIAGLVLYIAILAIIPFAIHGSFRYRMSRTSYRGIRFGYRGDRKELTMNFFKDVIFTIFTFGIYGAWLQMNLVRYTHQNIRYGDVEFTNTVNGGDWFILNLKGYLLTLITFGIYGFWWQKDMFAYYIDNIGMSKGEQRIQCQSTATGGGFFELLIINFFIIIFTLGFGKAWADVRTQKFICDHIKLVGNIYIGGIHQTEEEYTDAFGEETMDFLEIDLA